jgi:hypothetical protein
MESLNWLLRLPARFEVGDGRDLIGAELVNTTRLAHVDAQSHYANAISVHRPEKCIFEADAFVVSEFTPVH